jgi:thiosulfate reductase cytochrome b subunit
MSATDVRSTTTVSAQTGGKIYRHTLFVRLSHWLNAFFLLVMLMSGLQIFNAHPRLYWGQYGANADHAFLSLEAHEDAQGGASGVTQIGPFAFNTTGVFGLSRVNGEITERGFPSWATLPSGQDLATGRRWHFFFAWFFVINGIAYLAYGFLSRHFRKDLAPDKAELQPRPLARDIWNHLLLKRAKGAAAARYNTLQKLTYLIVIFLLLPLMLLTGLTMSPGMDAAFPWLLDLFGGRQSARTLHFLCAFSLVLFTLVHLAEVFIAGVWNEMRGMITGRYAIKPEARDENS